MLGAEEIAAINFFFEQLQDGRKVTPHHRTVLYLLCAWRNRDTGRCNPARETIARAVGVALRTLSYVLHDLREWGAVEWTQGGLKIGGKVTNSYRLLFLEEQEQEKLTPEQQEVWDYFTAMHDCYRFTLSEEEKLALAEWERSAKFTATSDWPGWETHIGKGPWYDSNWPFKPEIASGQSRVPTSAQGETQIASGQFDGSASGQSGEITKPLEANCYEASLKHTLPRAPNDARPAFSKPTIQKTGPADPLWGYSDGYILESAELFAHQHPEVADEHWPTEFREWFERQQEAIRTGTKL
jgi:hypothetical protein